MRINRRKREAELREELEFHLDAEAEERAAAGLPPKAARAAARRDLGNLGRVMEETRAAWGGTFLETLGQDLKLGVRSLRKNPGFSTLVVLILGAGIGANTAVFSVVNAVILKPLAYRDPGRIVVLSTLWKKYGPARNVSVPDFHDWHDQSRSFDAMAYHASGESAIATGGTSEFGAIAIVTNEFFQVFGVEPVAGRLFRDEETRPHANGAVLLSYSFWQSHYGSDPAALGKTIRIGGHTLPVVGILPPGFHFPGKTDIWFPANTIYEESTFRSAHNVQVVGKLKPGATLSQAQSEMTLIGDRLERRYPQSNVGKNVAVSELKEYMVHDSRLMLYLLLGAVALVLLVACANVANLLLARANSRCREVAVRVALGAGRMRIVRQLFTESLLLGLASGATGLLIAVAASRALVALAPGNVPRLTDTGIDGWVLAFTFAVSLVACLLFGLAPSLRVSRVDLHSALKQNAGRGPVGGHAAWRRALVAAEVALSVVLLTGAGLLLRSFAALEDVALGVRPENVLTMYASVPGANSDAAARQATAVFKKLLAEAATIPGVTAVGATRVLPGAVGSSGGYWVDQVLDAQQMRVDAPQAVYSIVAPGAFAAMGISIDRGRDFNAGDTFDAPFTVVINERLARRAFPGRDPLGHTIVTGFDSITPKPMTIVGVVSDVRQRGPESEADAEIFMPYEQHPGPSTALNIVARTTVPPELLQNAFRQKAHAVAPEMPVKFTSLQTRLAENVAAPRFRTLLLSIFAALALGLAMAGVYALVSVIAQQRTAEIGLRMALGAGLGDVVKLVISQGVWPALAGLALGLAGAFTAARLLSTMLFEIKPTDPLTYGGVAALIALMALAASYVPALRAARIDPGMALRQE